MYPSGCLLSPLRALQFPPIPPLFVAYRPEPCHAVYDVLDMRAMIVVCPMCVWGEVSVDGVHAVGKGIVV